MSKGVFLKKEFYDDFNKIFLDNDFSLKRFWFRRVVFGNIINSDWKIQWCTVAKLLIVYNTYYNSRASFKDLFNMNLIMNMWDYKQVEFEFQKHNSNDVLFRFIDEVLGRVKSV